MKKLITALTSFCLVFTSTFGGATAMVHGNTTETEGTNQQPTPAVLNEDTEYIRDPETGYIYPAEEAEVPISKEATANEEERTKASLPALYPADDAGGIISRYPATRSQSPYGTCWAHAAVACSEFDLVKNHGASKSLDLSELQLAYFCYHTVNDRLGNLNDDYNYMPNTAVEDFLNVGGNRHYALQTLAQGKGLTYESTLPYSYAATALSNGIVASCGQKSDGAKLENAYILDIKANPSAVKEAIQTYGAVQASYYHNSQYYDGSSGYALYYCSKANTGVNHDIAIVGWNDNLSASYFPSWNRPSRNGAWLIRNSWSTNNNGSESCYFWMSYDDKSLGNNVLAYDFVPGSKYANIYQHDGTTAYGYIGIEKAANVFTAQNPDGAGGEMLQAVMLNFMGEADVKYQIDIYSGLATGTTTDPESGYHHSYATTSGTTTYAGIHTIYLKEPVYLSPGEKYAIVVTSKNGMVYFTTEQTRDVAYNYNGKTVGWFSSKAGIDPGESLYKTYASYNGWADAATDNLTEYGNIRIKGLTTNTSAKKYTVSYNLNGGTVESGNPEWYFSTSGETALKTPTKEGYYFLGWYTEDGQKVTSLTGSLGRNLVLSAKWGAHAYKEEVLKRATDTEKGYLRKQCDGCDLSTDYYILVPTATLSYVKTTYSGEAKYPTAIVSVNGGSLSSSYYDVTYMNNVNVGRGKVIIEMNETYYDCTFEKSFSIVPKAATGVSAKLNGDYNNVKVSWNQVTGAEGYYVYYKKNSSLDYSKENCVDTAALTTTFKNLANGTKYTFKVVPYFEEEGEKYTAQKGATATATTLKKVVQKTPQKASSSKVKVRWTGISGESGYQVYKMKKSGSSYKKVKSYTTTKSYINVSATKGKTYYYKVRAYKKVGTKKIYGPWSDIKKYKL